MGLIVGGVNQWMGQNSEENSRHARFLYFEVVGGARAESNTVWLLFASVCQVTLRVPVILFLPCTESGRGDIEETDLEG
jgi:hypothetical protein